MLRPLTEKLINKLCHINYLITLKDAEFNNVILYISLATVEPKLMKLYLRNQMYPENRNKLY